MAKKDKKKKTNESTQTIQTEESESKQTSQTESKQAVTFSKQQYLILTLAILLVAAGLLYYFKGVFIAAVVNGQPISRLSVVSELERQAGKKALDTMVTKKLIMQEAEKRHVNVSQKELDAEAKNIEQSIQAQGQSLDQVLKTQGMTKEDFTEEVKIQKLLEKMVGDVKVTDDEVNKFLEQNKQLTTEGQNSDQMKASLKQSLKQEKMTQKIQTFIADLKKKAKVNYFVTY